MYFILYSSHLLYCTTVLHSTLHFVVVIFWTCVSIAHTWPISSRGRSRPHACTSSHLLYCIICLLSNYRIALYITLCSRMITAQCWFFLILRFNDDRVALYVSRFIVYLSIFSILKFLGCVWLNLYLVMNYWLVSSLLALFLAILNVGD